MITNPKTSVALVEDDPILREELAHFLRSMDFVVYETNNGISLDELLVDQHVDVLILDVNLPGHSGFDIANRVRLRSPQVGIVMLTARTSLSDRLRSYEAGADIFLPKPTPPQELLAAVNSLIRRLQAQPTGTPWGLDTQRRLLYTTHHPEPLALTAAEAALLLALIQAPNQTLESDAICELINCRDQAEPLTKRALENLISRLRKKISDVVSDKSEPIIRSVWGLGYQLTLPISIHTSAR